MSAQAVCRVTWPVVLALALLSPTLPGHPILLELEPATEDEPAEADSASEAGAAPPQAARRPLFTVDTLAGTRTVEGFEVVPNSQVVGLLLADTLLGSDWKRVETELVALRQGLGSRTRLKIVTAIGPELRLSGPFQNAEQLRAEIRSVQTQLSKPEPEASSETSAESRVATEGSAPADLSEPAHDGSEVSIADLVGKMEEIQEAHAQQYRQIGQAAALLECDWPTALAFGRLSSLESDLVLPSAAYLAERLRAQRVRFSLIPLDGSAPLAVDWLSFITGGTITSDVAGFLQHLDQETRFVEVEWPTPLPEGGFHLYQTDVRHEETGAVWTVPDAAVAHGWVVPEPLALKGFRERVAALQKAIGSASADESWIRSELESLAATNPSDEGLLRASIRFHESKQAWRAAADGLRRFSLIKPTDASVFSNLGTTLVRIEEWDEAEAAFQRLMVLEPAKPSVSEALGRVYARKGDVQQAMGLFDASLRLDPANQALWFYVADTAKQIGDSERRRQALIQGIALPRAPHERRAELIRVHLDSGNTSAATEQIETGAEAAANDPSFLPVYAKFSEEVGHSERALELWRQTRETDPLSAAAYAEPARIHFEKGEFARSQALAEAGALRFPLSVNLHLTLAESLERLERFYDLRSALRYAAEAVPADLRVLQYRARIEDTFGDGAPAAYRALAGRLAEESQPETLRTVLRRGLEVALRHSDFDQARWFANQAEHVDAAEAGLVPEVTQDGAEEVRVLGGLRALAYLAGANTPKSAKAFFQEYCRPIVFASKRSKQVYEEYSKLLYLYFETVRSLSALRDDFDDDAFSITLAMHSGKARERTRNVLGMLGWRVRGSQKRGFTLQPIESETGAERQEIGSALEIDEIAIQDALLAKQDYDLRIKVETAPMVLGETAWKEALYKGRDFAGGFMEAVVRDSRIGEAYIGLSPLQPSAREALIENVGLRQLVNRFSGVLLMHGSALAFEQGQALVPGGAEAASIWTGLVGARPSEPHRFFPRLLRKEEGRLLGYFSALGQLDAARQRFFTQSAARTKQFFALYKSSPEFKEGGRAKVRESPFLELLRELPLDAEGSVVFPGGAEVWMVARGQADAGRLARKLPRKVVPEVEDDILIRVAKTKFQTPNGQRSQVDKFLAAARLDQLRSQSMDAVTALNFAQPFGPYEHVFPYFATLTGLQSTHLRSFLALASKVDSLEPIRRNHLLALFHAFSEILCIGQLEGRLSEERAAELFGAMCLRLSSGKGATGQAEAALAMLESILEGVEGADTGDDIDQRMRTLLGLDGLELRSEEFQQVQELQGIPLLATLMQLRDSAQSLASGSGDLNAHAKSLDEAASEIPVVAIAKEMGFEDKKKRLMQSYSAVDLKQTQRRLARAVARKKPRQGELRRLGVRLVDEMLPQVCLALSGIVYSYYLRPDDLPVSEDPLFLRKHEYYKADVQFNDEYFEPTQLVGLGEDTGTYVEGGLSGMAAAAGHVARFGLRIMDPDAQALGGVELASLRAARWQQLGDADLRRLSLAVLLGREWIVEAASHQAARADLVRAVQGRLSVNRARQLLASITERDWPRVWDSVTRADLYRLGRERLAGPAERIADSPVATALLALPQSAEDWKRLDVLGSVRLTTHGYSRPRIWSDGPYEDYERYMSDTRIAERTAELKIYLAQAAYSIGMSADKLARSAEFAAKRVLSTVQMGDVWDWRSVLQNYEGTARLAIEDAFALQP